MARDLEERLARDRSSVETMVREAALREERAAATEQAALRLGSELQEDRLRIEAARREVDALSAECRRTHEELSVRAARIADKEREMEVRAAQASERQSVLEERQRALSLLEASLKGKQEVLDTAAKRIEDERARLDADGRRKVDEVHRFAEAALGAVQAQEEKARGVLEAAVAKDREASTRLAAMGGMSGDRSRVSLVRREERSGRLRAVSFVISAGGLRYGVHLI